MNYSEMMKTFSRYCAVSGYEEEVALNIKEAFKESCDEVEIDKFFNVIGVKKGIGENKKTVMVSAHFDEVGLIVSGIDDKGFVRFTNMGGIDTKILLAQEVIIHGKRDVFGVVGAKPPHLLKPEDARKAVKMEDLSIDTGLSAEKIKEAVSIGDVITFKVEPTSLLGNKIATKSIDNRCGVVALLGIMAELSKIKYRYDVCFVASTQEEVGLRGIKTASFNINPDLAIVIDACHAETPEVPKDEVFGFGKGPAVAIGPNLHKKLTQAIISTAKDENISVQTDVEPGETGTEAWAVQVSRSGIPTSLISVPVRYMHNPYEVVHQEDIKNTARLVAKFIGRLGSEVELL